MTTTLRRLLLVTTLVTVPFLLGLLPEELPRKSGVLPGELFIPPNVSSAMPSCGQFSCHDTQPNTNGPVTVSITAPRSLGAGAIAAVSVQVTGGPTRGLAGFTLESDNGTLIAGTETRTSATGDAITHRNNFGNSWPFQFRAPATPGPIAWTAVGQSVNGDNLTLGDSWAFYGPNSAVGGVAFRLFANAANVNPFGSGCAGTDGHEPLLGARAPMTTGQSFVAELHSVPANVTALCALGTNTMQSGGVMLPFDLGTLGAPGCMVLIDHAVMLVMPTTGAGSGGGAARFSWPVPNNPFLIGKVLYFQAYVLDNGANPGGLTATNGLTVTIQ